MQRDLSYKEQEKRILQILYGDEQKNLPMVHNESLRTYFVFLEKNLTFPMKGAYDQEIRPFETTLCPITIMKLLDDIDEFHGIFIEGIAGKKNEVIPLADFECNTTDQSNYQLVDDYKTWFWNNR
ncbi:MAG: hypothetical protein NTX92_08470 [Euryarchaeota archaeon]|jgi:hypothetical protein|nr:hypothetical protein [Euryarchaeota archaeon]